MQMNLPEHGYDAFKVNISMQRNDTSSKLTFNIFKNMLIDFEQHVLSNKANNKQISLLCKATANASINQTSNKTPNPRCETCNSPGHPTEMFWRPIYCEVCKNWASLQVLLTNNHLYTLQSEGTPSYSMQETDIQSHRPKGARRQFSML